MILDCCAAGSAVGERHEGMAELLVACGSDMTTPLSGRSCFTRKVADNLKVSFQDGIEVYDLYHRLAQDYNISGPQTQRSQPLHYFQGLQIHSVFLRRMESFHSARSRQSSEVQSLGSTTSLLGSTWSSRTLPLQANEGSELPMTKAGGLGRRLLYELGGYELLRIQSRLVYTKYIPGLSVPNVWRCCEVKRTRDSVVKGYKAEIPRGTVNLRTLPRHIQELLRAVSDGIPLKKGRWALDVVGEGDTYSLRCMIDSSQRLSFYKTFRCQVEIRIPAEFSSKGPSFMLDAAE